VQIVPIGGLHLVQLNRLVDVTLWVARNYISELLLSVGVEKFRGRLDRFMARQSHSNIFQSNICTVYYLRLPCRMFFFLNADTGEADIYYIWGYTDVIIEVCTL
jgi:hypothetical protein